MATESAGIMITIRALNGAVPRHAHSEKFATADIVFHHVHLNALMGREDVQEMAIKYAMTMMARVVLNGVQQLRAASVRLALAGIVSNLLLQPVITNPLFHKI